MSNNFARLAGIYIDSKHTEISNFSPLEVVDCSSMTQLLRDWLETYCFF